MKNPIIEIDSHSFSYKMAGIAAFLIVLVRIMDIFISTLAGEAKANTLINVTEWFDLFQSNRIAAYIIFTLQFSQIFVLSFNR